MRKKLLVYLIILLSITGLTSFINVTKEIDEKLIGDWKGFEKDTQIEGLEKHWIQHRSKDGTFFIIFTSLQNCEIETHIEKGKWWTEKGKFYEFHEDSKLTDIYEYEVVEDLMVKFKSVKLLGEKSETYEFIDYKLE